MNVEELFPTTRERLWAAMYGSPVPHYTAEVDFATYDTLRGDPALVRKLEHLDPVGRALLLELKRYRYKPDATFELVQLGRGATDPVFYGSGGYQIKISISVPDSRWTPDARRDQTEKDRPTVPVHGSPKVWEPLYWGGGSPREREEMFRAMLRAFIQAMEDHETDEWFACDGALVHDPHAQKVPSEIGPIHA